MSVEQAGISAGLHRGNGPEIARLVGANGAELESLIHQGVGLTLG
jgi:hypothetical protein